MPLNNEVDNYGNVIVTPKYVYVRHVNLPCMTSLNDLTLGNSSTEFDPLHL